MAQHEFIIDRNECLKENLRRGDELFHLTKYDEAINFFDNVILKLYEKENDFKNEDEKRLTSEAYFRKGRSFLRLGKLHKSIENFNEAIKFRSNHVFAYIMKGFALQDIKRNSESREIFENCLNLIETESMKEKKNELKLILNYVYYF